mgnify:CR=1 FL=1|tara:strand:+ start:103 stop:348 length:246 start_codon:yes stop_codon:yes gene_type:complete
MNITTPTKSRTELLDNQKCIDNAGGNQFNMILIASVRAREISKISKEKGNLIFGSPIVSAMLELQNSMYDKKYLNKVKKTY